MTRPRVLLADDHTLLLHAFRLLLEPRFEVVGAVEDGEALLEAAAALSPDVVVTDVSMPRLDGIDACRLLRERCPGARVVFLTVAEEPEVAAAAFSAGASAFILKSSTATLLVQAIEAALAGRLYLTPRIAGGDVDALPLQARGSPLDRLSAREREVVLLLAEGLAMKQVASRLGIATRTVAFHKYRAMRALSVRSGAALFRLVDRSGRA